MAEAIASFWIAVWVWVVPATLSIGCIAVFVALVHLAGGIPSYFWLLLSPSLYLVWLIAFLYFCGKTIGPMGRRYPKPRYAILPGAQPGRFRFVMASTMRMGVIYSLPLVPLLEVAKWGRRLIILGYSYSMHFGNKVQGSGKIEDPDLTEIGERVVLGAGVAIGAHFWNNLPSGKRIFVTAPVKIGARATIGAYSLVSLGCQIGEDAIIEPHSYLLPHTEVPAGEIWGGRPAVFLKKRTRESAARADAVR
ncbi:MAG TPA: DapH/DapD/GlmU-related protein [Bryobacteraceae bacterium]|jgi:acetyltransferase-like isoleucine patch superfamily enzyme